MKQVATESDHLPSVGDEQRLRDAAPRLANSQLAGNPTIQGICMDQLMTKPAGGVRAARIDHGRRQRAFRQATGREVWNCALQPAAQGALSNPSANNPVRISIITSLFDRLVSRLNADSVAIMM